MKKMVLASNNTGKVREFNEMLADVDIEVVAQKAFNVESVPETGLTFVENAIIKARHAADITGLPAFSDDSGIEVDALNRAPGIYSARFAGENATDEANNQLLREKLAHVPEAQRTARYQCVLVFMEHAADPTPIICQGSWEGVIQLEARGDNGFGYDPYFYLPDFGCTAAELSREQKNQVSHRGIALRALHDALMARYRAAA